MGKIKPHPKVKLIIGFIYKEEAVFNKAGLLLEKKFGKIDFQTNPIQFTYTAYYEKEFGANLKRAFASFDKLIQPEKLAKIKIFTNRIEEKLAHGSNRAINIDPGYLDLAKLILASTKDFRHRIYIGDGIFAETTLFYQDKTFKPGELTYPDYRSAEYIATFNKIRDIYAGQIK